MMMMIMMMMMMMMNCFCGIVDQQITIRLIFSSMFSKTLGETFGESQVLKYLFLKLRKPKLH